MKLVIGALLAITGALFMLPGAASAHAVTLSIADKACLETDGSWSIQWTVDNSEDDQPMQITSGTVMKFNDVVVADPPFTPNPVPGGGSATATTSFGPDSTTWFVDLTVEADWPDDNAHDGDVLRVFKPTETCFVPDCENSEEYAAENPRECGVTTICSNGELVTGTESELANLPVTDDCDEDPCAFDKDLSADDSDCTPPPEFGEVCVDTDDDGKGDEYQLFTIGNPPAGAIMTASGDACTPVTLPEEPQIQEVQAVAEVLPVALPAAGNGGTATSTTAFAGLAGLAVVLLAGGSMIAMVARRR